MFEIVNPEAFENNIKSVGLDNQLNERESILQVENDKPPESTIDNPVIESTIISRSIAKKCMFKTKEGKKCRKNALDDNIYCEVHKDQKPNIKIDSNTCIKALMSLHIVTYMTIESITPMLNFPVEGLNESLTNDKEEVEKIYQNIVDTYGVEAISDIVSPLTALGLVIAKHGIEGRTRYLKKNTD